MTNKTYIGIIGFDGVIMGVGKTYEDAIDHCTFNSPEEAEEPQEYVCFSEKAYQKVLNGCDDLECFISDGMGYDCYYLDENDKQEA